MVVGSVNGFVKTSGKRTRSQALFYRTEAVSILEPRNVASLLHPPASDLPAWLAVPRSHLLQENLRKLKTAMLDSFFAENDAHRLVFAIEEASKGDLNKMAGAAEFCLILVDTMEMGLNVLIAAAFHYCSCVAAREAPGPWKQQGEHPGLHMFGEHAMEIARDAANLKKMEMVFSSIMSPKHSSRVSPDSNDAENLRNLLLTETKDWRALAIRSAACLYRLRGLELAGISKLTPEAARASREALHIYAPLACRLGMQRLKNELEEAAFKTLYRRQYNTVTSLARQIRFQKSGRGSTRRGLIEMAENDAAATDISQSMKHILEDVTEDVREMLRNDPVFTATTESVDVSARVKEPYSIWKKMLRTRSSHILDVPDALALRIVLTGKKMTPDEDSEVTRARERALCYYAQQLCTQRWAPMKGNARFKDYIDNPKANGYQSLHYTATTQSGNEDWNLEIQVRSAEMHKVAEYGLASHWDYKAKKKGAASSSTDHSSDAYLRSVQEWHWQQQRSNYIDANPVSYGSPLIWSHETEAKARAKRIRERTARLAPFIEAFALAQSDLARERVFVFLSQSQDTLHPDGNILALPAGACVLDALREGAKQFGSDWAKKSEKALSRNGVVVNLTQQLRNGDVLTVAIQPTLVTNWTYCDPFLFPVHIVMINCGTFQIILSFSPWLVFTQIRM